METLVIKITKKQSLLVKQFLDQQKVSYVTSQLKVKQLPKKEKPYDPKFVEMVLNSKKGKSYKINPEKLWESIV